MTEIARSYMTTEAREAAQRLRERADSDADIAAVLDELYRLNKLLDDRPARVVIQGNTDNVPWQTAFEVERAQIYTVTIEDDVSQVRYTFEQMEPRSLGDMPGPGMTWEPLDRDTRLPDA